MNVGELMTRDVGTCTASDSMNDAARIMWERDCGCVPVVDDGGKVVGMTEPNASGARCLCAKCFFLQLRVPPNG